MPLVPFGRFILPIAALVSGNLSAAVTANRAYALLCEAPDSILLRGVGFVLGTGVTTDTVDVAVADERYNVLARSSAPTALGVTSGRVLVPFSAPYRIKAGQAFYLEANFSAGSTVGCLSLASGSTVSALFGAAAGRLLAAQVAAGSAALPDPLTSVGGSAQPPILYGYV